MMDSHSSWFDLLLRIGIGVSVFAGLMFWATRTMAQFWRRAAQAYAGRANTPRTAAKFPETIVITGRTDRRRASDRSSQPWYTYFAVSIEVHPDGLTLAMVPPFSAACPRMFLPFADMELQKTWWALWPEPVAIRMRRTPDIDIIVSREVATWLREQA